MLVYIQYIYIPIDITITSAAPVIRAATKRMFVCICMYAVCMSYIYMEARARACVCMSVRACTAMMSYRNRKFLKSAGCVSGSM